MIVMTFVVGAINIVTDIRLTNSADQKLAFISENNGDIKNHSPLNKDGNNSGWIIQMTQETPFEMRYFAVYYDKNKNIMTSNLERIASITSEEASNMANEVIIEGTKQGYSGLPLSGDRYFTGKNDSIFRLLQLNPDAKYASVNICYDRNNKYSSGHWNCRSAFF